MKMPRAQTAVILVVVGVLFIALFARYVTRSEDHTGGDMVLGDPSRSHLDEWPGVFQAPMTTYDINGDGRQEIVAQSTDRSVYVFDTGSGLAVAELRSKYPPAWFIDQVSNGVDVGVLEPGQPPSVVAVNHAAYVSAWQYVPDKSSAKDYVFEKSWELRANHCNGSPSADGGGVLADLTGDGTLEVLVQTEEVGLFAFEGDGSLLWKQCWAGGNGAPVAADLDDDGRLEAIFASDSGFVSVLDGASGAPLWTFDARKHGIKPASISISTVVADIDGEPPKEVLFTTRHAPVNDPELFDQFSMGIFAIHQNPKTWQAELVWMRQPEWAHPLSYTHLVVEDVDDDGKADIFGMDWNTIGHRPGSWERLGPGHAFRLDSEGNDVWVREIDAWWSNKDIALADTNGDGELELLVNGAKAGEDGVWLLDVATGKSLGHHGANGMKLLGGPNLLDLRGDGEMQLAFRVTFDDETTRGGILVRELDTPFVSPHWGGG